MENRKQAIFLSVVGVATLLVTIVGATFAYFTIQVSGNNTASSITITTADVASVTFADGPGIAMTNVYPGYEGTKTFTVKTTGGAANSSIQYRIQLVTTTTTLPAASNTTGEVYYKLSGTKNGSGTVATTVTSADLPKTNTTTTIGTGTLVGNETHTYTFKAGILERGVAQDDLQGKAFAGKIQIELAANDGNRTWDATNSTWKKWTN